MLWEFDDITLILLPGVWNSAGIIDKFVDVIKGFVCISIVCVCGGGGALMYCQSTPMFQLYVLYFGQIWNLKFNMFGSL